MVTAMDEPASISHPFRKEGLRRIGHFDHPALVHLKDADLGGRAKTVLDGAQQAVGLEVVTLQIEDGIHDMFQHPRSGDHAPFLVTWPITKTAMPEVFASSRNLDALSRTCETDPALDSISGR